MNRFLIFVCMLSLTACFEPREACLDISATNFDAGADKDCCCEYPKLRFTVNQIYDTLLFRNETVYPDANGHFFRINSASFYLSDFHLFQAGNDFQVSDTLTMSTYAGADTSSQLFVNDFQLVRRSPVEYTIGSFRQDGNFDAIGFQLGLSAGAQKVIPAKAPANHPLAIQTDPLWLSKEEGFVFMQLVVAPDSLAATTPDTLRFTEGDLGQRVLGGSGLFVHPTGYDFPVVLTIDYKMLFDGVNWSNHDISAWKTKIISNLDAAFMLSQ